MKKSAKTVAIAATFAVALTATSCNPPENKPGKLVGGDVYDPYFNEEPCVYGPAPDYDPDDDNNIVQTEYGVPYFDEYDPADEIPEEVYGPPPDMDFDD